jgi:hypothetical protein
MAVAGPTSHAAAIVGDSVSSAAAYSVDNAIVVQGSATAEGFIVDVRGERLKG